MRIPFWRRPLVVVLGFGIAILYALRTYRELADFYDIRCGGILEFLVDIGNFPTAQESAKRLVSKESEAQILEFISARFETFFAKRRIERLIVNNIFA